MDKEIIWQLAQQIHSDCYTLINAAFHEHFGNSGNLGIFCQNEEEFQKLTQIRLELTKLSNNPNQKYYTLHEPIVIPVQNSFPEAIYTHLYIRKPDPSPYGHYRGDIDFFTNESEYEALLKQVAHGERPHATQYEQPGVGTLIQVAQKEIKSVAYLSTKAMTMAVRVRH